jgi:hypothetical protein
MIDMDKKTLLLRNSVVVISNDSISPLLRSRMRNRGGDGFPRPSVLRLSQRFFYNEHPYVKPDRWP